MPRSRSERRVTGSFTDAMTRGVRSGRARGRRARLSRGHPLLFLDDSLAVDAIARGRQSLEALLGDGVAAPLPRGQPTVLQLLPDCSGRAPRTPIAGIPPRESHLPF